MKDDASLPLSTQVFRLGRGSNNGGGQQIRAIGIRLHLCARTLHVIVDIVVLTLICISRAIPHTSPHANISKAQIRKQVRIKSRSYGGTSNWMSQLGIYITSKSEVVRAVSRQRCVIHVGANVPFQTCTKGFNPLTKVHEMCLLMVCAGLHQRVHSGIFFSLSGNFALRNQTLRDDVVTRNKLGGNSRRTSHLEIVTTHVNIHGHRRQICGLYKLVKRPHSNKPKGIKILQGVCRLVVRIHIVGLPRKKRD
mmetsp:Transcript_13142/g.16241  ORF Transcript_13142/g.16241 Transcript_13142/m.16241 type:complete len:251 (+) Transcript_13142:532-1284(+)